MDLMRNYQMVISKHIALFVSILIVPSFFFAYFQMSSMFPGLIVSYLLCVFFLKKLSLTVNFEYILIFFTVSLYCLVSISNGGDLFKILLSAISFFIMLYIASSQLKKLDRPVNGVIVRTVQYVYYGFLVIGFCSLFVKFPFGGYQLKHGSVFPFAEYSHFAISFCFISLLHQFIVNNNKGLMNVIPTFILGLAFPNLTTVIVGFLQVFLLKSRYKILITSLFICIAIPLISIFMTDYISARLVFDGTNKNLSNLVYLQGVESIYLSFMSNFGLGVGFQNMGMQEPGFFTELIRSANNGNDLNRFDGGFLASKLLTEFGLFGLAFCILACYNFFKVCKIMWSDYKGVNILFFIYTASSCQIIIELFVRGYGYFSPTFIIFICLLFFRKDIYKLNGK